MIPSFIGKLHLCIETCGIILIRVRLVCWVLLSCGSMSSLLNKCPICSAKIAITFNHTEIHSIIEVPNITTLEKWQYQSLVWRWSPYSSLVLFDFPIKLLHCLALGKWILYRSMPVEAPWYQHLSLVLCFLFSIRDRIFYTAREVIGADHHNYCWCFSNTIRLFSGSVQCYNDSEFKQMRSHLSH